MDFEFAETSWNDDTLSNVKVFLFFFVSVLQTPQLVLKYEVVSWKTS